MFCRNVKTCEQQIFTTDVDNNEDTGHSSVTKGGGAIGAAAFPSREPELHCILLLHMQFLRFPGQAIVIEIEPLILTVLLQLQYWSKGSIYSIYSRQIEHLSYALW